MTPLTNKHILLGVSGGIAAYKSTEIVRELKRCGAEVKVIMTQAAQAFITPLTLQALSQNPVYTDQWLTHSDTAMDHIELARWADLMLIAPATADTIARIAHSHANDLLTSTCLAIQAPILIAPAMNQGMWKHPGVQANIIKLQQYRIEVIPPAIGEQACGDVGQGRLREPVELVSHLMAQFSKPLFLDRTILITAGPTQEAIDPVRYLGNHSSGKMGYALAQAAAQQAKVILISGPTTLVPPPNVKVIHITSAEEMLTAVMSHVNECDIFISAAAVADYRPLSIATHKIKKSSQELVLTLVPNKDILATVAALKNKPFLVGFAAETENLVANAKQKMSKKQLDLIIANQVGTELGFSVDNNAAMVIDKTGKVTEFPEMPKLELAKKLMQLISTYTVDV